MADQDPPLLRVINADATPEEVAALVAVFSVLSQSAGETPRRRRRAWSDPARAVRRTHLSGADGWRSSGLPR